MNKPNWAIWVIYTHFLLKAPDLTFYQFFPLLFLSHPKQQQPQYIYVQKVFCVKAMVFKKKTQAFNREDIFYVRIRQSLTTNFTVWNFTKLPFRTLYGYVVFFLFSHFVIKWKSYHRISFFFSLFFPFVWSLVLYPKVSIKLYVLRDVICLL